MVALSTHPMRALSPITELTTPTSLRTLQLPLDEADYLSERIPRDSLDTTRPGDNANDDDDVSVYSQKAFPPPRWNGSTSSLNRSATPTPDDTHKDDQAIPFPSSSASPAAPGPAPRPGPGGLPPPFRSTTSTGRPAKLIKRVTPPASPRQDLYLDEEARKRLTEAFRPPYSDDSSVIELEANMAGIGAGKSLSQPPSRVGSRRKSLNTNAPDLGNRGNSPSKLDISHDHQAQTQPTQTQNESTYFNIPFLDLPPKKKGSPTAARSRPNSLKKRPKSYHDSRPGSQKSRPNSFHGSVTKEGISPEPASPVLGLDTGSKEMDKPVLTVEPVQTLTTSPQSTLRPQLVKRQSESSLPKRSNTARSTSPSQKSPRRRRVSSILSSIFGSTPDSEHVSRKLSKKSKATTVSTSGTSRGSTPPSPTSPPGQGLTDSPIAEEGTNPVQTAIRTSGTFGIRDDGSEVSKLPQSLLSPRTGYDRTESGDGSVITHSDGVKRVLYVENHVDTPDKEVPSISGEKKAFYTPMTTIASSPAVDHAGGLDPRALPAGNVNPSAAEHSIAESDTHPNLGRRPDLPHQQSFPPHLSSVGISYSSTHSLNSDHYGLGVLFPHQAHSPAPPSPHLLLPPGVSPVPLVSPAVSLPSLLNHHLQSLTQLGPNTGANYNGAPIPPVTPGNGAPRTRPNSTNTVDESIQTSRQTSPSKTPRSRPLPQPPSRATSPLLTPEPTFIPPPPPETSPTTDLPLLIASHLLSTHAAALMRHSPSMNEASETMRKMAKESLDWGGVLMRMADKKPRPSASLEGLPTVHEHPEGGSFGSYEGIPLPKSASTSTSTSRPTPRPGNFASHQHLPVPDQQGNYDPIREAYDHLTSLPPRPTTTRSAIRGESRRRKADSLPADLLKEAQRLGNEGWRSLHAAEAAWAGAMGRLSEMLEQQQFVGARKENGKSDEDGAEENVYPRMGVASTLPPSSSQSQSQSQSQSADSHDNVIVQPRSNAPTPMTTLSYPLGSPNTIPISQLSVHMSPAIGHGRSFLPDEGDMMSPASVAGTVNTDGHGHGHVHGHTSYPYPLNHSSSYHQGIVNGSNMTVHLDGGNHEQGLSESTIRARPTAISPSPTIHIHSHPPASPPPGSTHIPYPRTLVRLDHPFTQHLAAQFDHEVSGGARLHHGGQVHVGSGVSGGYTNAALGLDAPLTGSSASNSHSHSRSYSYSTSNPNSNSQDRQRERETPSRSTITSSSNNHAQIHGPESSMSATATGTGTGTGTGALALKGGTAKKLAKKKHPLRGSQGTPGGSLSGFGFISGNEDEINGSRGDDSGAMSPDADGTLRKKHWWNRKKD
ncbi:hypothetical protein IAT40_001190 [Kwoniella sp. CBS 6097]